MRYAVYKRCEGVYFPRVDVMGVFDSAEEAANIIEGWEEYEATYDHHPNNVEHMSMMEIDDDADLMELESVISAALVAAKENEEDS